MFPTRSFPRLKDRIPKPGGEVAVVPKRDLVKSEPLSQSLMPVGLEHGLSVEELRDPMTFIPTNPAGAGNTR